MSKYGLAVISRNGYDAQKFVENRDELCTQKVMPRSCSGKHIFVLIIPKGIINVADDRERLFRRFVFVYIYFTDCQMATMPCPLNMYLLRGFFKFLANTNSAFKN